MAKICIKSNLLDGTNFQLFLSLQVKFIAVFISYSHFRFSTLFVRLKQIKMKFFTNNLQMAEQTTKSTTEQRTRDRVQ